MENNDSKIGDYLFYAFIIFMLSSSVGIGLDRWYMQTLCVKHGAAHWVTSESGISTFEWNKK